MTPFCLLLPERMYVVGVALASFNTATGLSILSLPRREPVQVLCIYCIHLHSCNSATALEALPTPLSPTRWSLTLRPVPTLVSQRTIPTSVLFPSLPRLGHPLIGLDNDEITPVLCMRY